MRISLLKGMINSLKVNSSLPSSLLHIGLLASVLSLSSCLREQAFSDALSSSSSVSSYHFTLPGIVSSSVSSPYGGGVSTLK